MILDLLWTLLVFLAVVYALFILYVIRILFTTPSGIGSANLALQIVMALATATLTFFQILLQVVIAVGSVIWEIIRTIFNNPATFIGFFVFAVLGLLQYIYEAEEYIIYAQGWGCVVFPPFNFYVDNVVANLLSAIAFIYDLLLGLLFFGLSVLFNTGRCIFLRLDDEAEFDEVCENIFLGNRERGMGPEEAAIPILRDASYYFRKNGVRQVPDSGINPFAIALDIADTIWDKFVLSIVFKGISQIERAPAPLDLVLSFIPRVAARVLAAVYNLVAVIQPGWRTFILFVFGRDFDECTDDIPQANYDTTLGIPILSDIRQILVLAAQSNIPIIRTWPGLVGCAIEFTKDIRDFLLDPLGDFVADVFFELVAGFARFVFCIASNLEFDSVFQFIVAIFSFIFKPILDFLGPLGAIVLSIIEGISCFASRVAALIESFSIVGGGGFLGLRSVSPLSDTPEVHHGQKRIFGGLVGAASGLFGGGGFGDFLGGIGDTLDVTGILECIENFIDIFRDGLESSISALPFREVIARGEPLPFHIAVHGLRGMASTLSVPLSVPAASALALHLSSAPGKRGIAIRLPESREQMERDLLSIEGLNVHTGRFSNTTSRNGGYLDALGPRDYSNTMSFLMRARAQHLGVSRESHCGGILWNFEPVVFGASSEGGQVTAKSAPFWELLQYKTCEVLAQRFHLHTEGMRTLSRMRDIPDHATHLRGTRDRIAASGDLSPPGGMGAYENPFDLWNLLQIVENEGTFVSDLHMLEAHGSVREDTGHHKTLFSKTAERIHRAMPGLSRALSAYTGRRIGLSDDDTGFDLQEQETCMDPDHAFALEVERSKKHPLMQKSEETPWPLSMVISAYPKSMGEVIMAAKLGVTPRTASLRAPFDPRDAIDMATGEGPVFEQWRRETEEKSLEDFIPRIMASYEFTRDVIRHSGIVYDPHVQYLLMQMHLKLSALNPAHEWTRSMLTNHTLETMRRRDAGGLSLRDYAMENPSQFSFFELFRLRVFHTTASQHVSDLKRAIDHHRSRWRQHERDIGERDVHSSLSVRQMMMLPDTNTSVSPEIIMRTLESGGRGDLDFFEWILDRVLEAAGSTLGFVELVIDFAEDIDFEEAGNDFVDFLRDQADCRYPMSFFEPGEWRILCVLPPVYLITGPRDFLLSITEVIPFPPEPLKIQAAPCVCTPDRIADGTACDVEVMLCRNIAIRGPLDIVLLILGAIPVWINQLLFDPGRLILFVLFAFLAIYVKSYSVVSGPAAFGFYAAVFIVQVFFLQTRNAFVFGTVAALPIPVSILWQITIGQIIGGDPTPLSAGPLTLVANFPGRLGFFPFTWVGSFTNFVFGFRSLGDIDSIGHRIARFEYVAEDLTSVPAEDLWCLFTRFYYQAALFGIFFVVTLAIPVVRALSISVGLLVADLRESIANINNAATVSRVDARNASERNV